MLHALIVDDSKAELDVLLFLINQNSLPLSIVTAFNGEEALTKLHETTFDILITDIRMPFVDGLDLAKEARTLHPNIVIIISSGYQDFSYAKTAISLGVKEYLLKPINPTEFVSLIKRLINQITEEKELLQNDNLKIVYSRNQITHQLINGTLRPQKDGLLPDNIRAIMPASCVLVLVSVEEKELSALQNLRSEIVHLGNHFWEYACRYIQIKEGLLLILDSPPFPNDMTDEILNEQAEFFSEKLQQMYRLIFQAAAGRATPEEIPDLVHQMTIQFSLESNDGSDINSTLSPELSTSDGKIRFVCDYINEHYKEDLNLEGLAKVAYIHPDYLSRTFKKVTGMNLNRYIKTFRLNKACQLLENTQQKITAISSEVGYQNCTYFIRSFTDMFGISPEKYRQKQQYSKKEDTQ